MEHPGESEFQFSQPFSQIMTMLFIVGAVLALGYLAYPSVGPTFLANPYLNGFILFVFMIGVVICFAQVFSLIRSVQWIEAFVSQRYGNDLTFPPQLLVPLANLLQQQGARSQLGASSTRSILDSVAQRIDEQRELTRYVSNMLIFLGLLGTFYGLATTVPALVSTIQSLTPQGDENALDIFARLQSGLEGQLDGMGIAFASSLLGLAGSLVVGLLEVFAGRGQNRFYGELEEWLSSITRVGFAGGELAGNQNMMAALMEQLADQMDGMAQMYAQASAGQADVEARLLAMTNSLEKLSTRLEYGQTDVMERVAVNLENLLAQQGDGGDGIDPESRMRLRSIDTQLNKMVEEMEKGRQESVNVLRNDLNNLTKAIGAFLKNAGQRGGQQPKTTPRKDN